MATQAELQAALAQMPNIENATVVGGLTLVATVVSGSFRNQDEADRQAAVWAYLRNRLGSGELQNIEFIFTNTPEENTAA
jgi:acid stress-induced BolA-like protein IbaG/YrbA